MTEHDDSERDNLPPLPADIDTNPSAETGAEAPEDQAEFDSSQPEQDDVRSDEQEQPLASLPLLPLRDLVIFPEMAASLLVGRDDSIAAVNTALENRHMIALFTQREVDCEHPGAADLHEVGVEAKILQFLKMPDGTIKLLVEGQRRIHFSQLFENNGVRMITPEYLACTDDTGALAEGLVKRVLEQFERYNNLAGKSSDQYPENLLEEQNAGKIADFIAQILPGDLGQKQRYLETLSVTKLLELLLENIENHINIQLVERKIKGRVKNQMERSQKEFYLSEQIKAIKQELGESDEIRSELEELDGRIKSAGMPKDAEEKAALELKRLKQMSATSAEATVLRNYLDWLLDVPWKKRSRLVLDIRKADKSMKADHYGLNKVREKILEHLAVQARNKNTRGSILCFVGPPGVGKTSLGKSIAQATGREFVRMALGGVRDESEIRGHRRTYIGAMPGRIIQGMKKAKTVNPLFLLDEIDKLGNDWRGDPTSALLEVLDPEQNKAFSDHYLEVDYDLSKVMFVTTANTLNIPAPLRDRMEIVEIDGYTEEEKKHIAHRHLMPKIMKDAGLKKNEWQVSPSVVLDLIRHYTREAGVRGLERNLMSLARKAVKQLLENPKHQHIKVTRTNLAKFLGPKRYTFHSKNTQNQIGVVNGLAWSSVGGDILHIEAVAYPGDGKFSKTGKLGEVMKESIEAAEHLLRARANHFGIKREMLKKTSIHVHVPEGATPKDGPSAGLAMLCAMISVLSQIPIKQDVAMTGEITLRGKILPIGGLKQKLLAAARGGVRLVLIPEENRKDLVDVPKSIQQHLKIIPVSYLDEALEHVLETLPEPVVDEEMLAESHQADALGGQETSAEASQRKH